MELSILLTIIFVLVHTNHGFLHSKKINLLNTSDNRIFANVKIFSNLAEIIQPLGKLPLEFSAEDWSDIRSDSITLVGANVNVTQQTVTEKKKSLNNAEVYVRSPSSSNSETKYIRATMIDEKRNLVKLLDKDISKDTIYLTVSESNMVYNEAPPQSKYYVNFTYDTTSAVYLSYLRSNLNWKTSYQLNLFEETKPAVLIAMADIRNEGQSKIDIEHAELLGGDINLQAGSGQIMYNRMEYAQPAYAAMADFSQSSKTRSIQLSRGEELAGLYVFSISEPFSIEAKTNFLFPMHRPRVTVDRFASISNTFYGGANFISGKAKRAYRLISDRFLSSGNCLIREQDRLVGETALPDLAAKDKHEFTIGQDADITYKENATLVSSRIFNETIRPGSREILSKTISIYEFRVMVKNFKQSRGVKAEYEQNVVAQSVKLVTPNTMFTQEGSKIKTSFTVGADEEKVLTYKVEMIN